MKTLKTIGIGVLIFVIGGLILSLFAGSNDRTDNDDKADTTVSDVQQTEDTSSEAPVKLGEHHIVDQAALSAMTHGTTGYFVLDGKTYFGIKCDIPEDLLSRDTYCCVIQNYVVDGFIYKDNSCTGRGTSNLKTIESVAADSNRDTLGLDVGYFFGIFFEFENCSNPEALLAQLDEYFFEPGSEYSIGAYEAEPPPIERPS